MAMVVRVYLVFRGDGLFCNLSYNKVISCSRRLDEKRTNLPADSSSTFYPDFYRIFRGDSTADFKPSIRFR